MTNKKFIETLAAIPSFQGDKERQVEQAYNAMLQDSFPGISISNPFKCDGFFETEINGRKTGIIIEYKYDYDFSKKGVRSQVLAQVVFYLKKFEAAGKPFPAVVIVGDVDECFVVHSNYLLKFLDLDGVDWTVAPSSASSQVELVTALANDESRNAFVFDVNDSFKWDDVYNQIVDCATNVVRLIHVTEHNIDAVFKLFNDKVLKKTSLSANDIVGVFLGCITDSDNYYLHPKKKNVLVTPNNGSLVVDGAWFTALMQRFDTNPSPVEKKRLISICDRLIEDVNRRKKGEFYTPTPFVDYAHGRMTQVLGDDWKDDGVVWDCCCGTKNLTRDYQFKELYCSTLEQAELGISEKYNPTASTFQFDFLNDELKRQSQGGKVPDGLMDALEGGKKVTFLLNPPYARNNGGGSMGGTSESVAFTKVNGQMKRDKIGACSANLFAQFLYRIMSIKRKYGSNVSIGLFCSPLFLSGSSFNKFRERFLVEFKYEDGFLFNAGHFADTAATWGINFSIWTSGETVDKKNFKHDLIDLNENGEITKVGERTQYNIDGETSANEWMKAVQSDKIEFPNLTSGVVVSESGTNKIAVGSIGSMLNGCNNITGNAKLIALSTGAIKMGGTPTYSVLASNLLRVCPVFAARKLVQGNWMNQKDEYRAPDTTNGKYPQFEADSIVYSLFHSASQQTSLRNVQYKGKSWDIPNEFFWLTRQDVATMANDAGLEETYLQATVARNDRHVCGLLKQVWNNLSPEAKEVLNAATELVRKTMKLRTLFNDEHPEYQVLNWDIGWYQLKAILNQYLPDDLEKFRETYNKLADKLRPMVYELGFLRK